MVKKSVKISWDIEARNHFYDAIIYIKRQSPQNAEMVKQKVISAVSKLSGSPNKYPIDKYRNNNDGSFRAIELFHFRISYHISENEIRIVRFRHTDMKPLEF